MLAVVLWIAGVGARLAFALSAQHGGQATIGRFSVVHHTTSGETWVAALVLMALLEVVSCNGVLAVRFVRQPQGDALEPPAAPCHVGTRSAASAQGAHWFGGPRRRPGRPFCGMREVEETGVELPAEAEAEVEVEVQVLGPVAVQGAARPLRRPWALELVVYLAFHPGGATSDAWATALWPDRLVADPTRHSTVSAARRALGRSAAGRDHLPHGRGVLRLGPTVGTDWDRFCRLADSSDPRAWEAALGLVRGRPFDGLRGGGDWTVLEGIGPHVEDAVVEVALRLADHLLGVGDGRGAERAARAGLRSSPYDERLYRALLRAADRQGNPAGVERAMAELLRVVGASPDERHDLDPWVHPVTAQLYRTLRRHGRPVAWPAGHGPPAGAEAPPGSRHAGEVERQVARAC